MTTRALRLLTLVAIVVWLVTLVLDPRASLNGYLVAFAAVVTVLAGALLQAMISYLTGAVWFTLLRRYNWMVVSIVWTVALLVLPLVIGVRSLYPWTSGPTRHSSWLAIPWFIGRTVLYVGSWIWLAERMLRLARQQDHAGAVGMAATTRSLRRWSGGGAIVVGLTLTFAGFDWIMSRDPTWTSTIFGIYLFAGGYLAALALIALLACTAPADSPLASAVSADQRGALGTLLFMAAIFWGYIAFSQFLIIWIGDIPADARWYVARGTGGWRALGYAVLVMEFALPFLLLLFRRLKRDRRALAAIAAIVLTGHLFDSYWTIGPAAPGEGFNQAWHAVLALLVVAALATLVLRHRRPLFDTLPMGDPDLDRAVAYRRP
ncbi:MAG TPA: hypothetical protein VGM77_03385 [Gemmatimonadales bacterium]